MATLKKKYGKYGEEILIAFCKKPDEFTKTIKNKISLKELAELAKEIKKFQISLVDYSVIQKSSV